MEVVRVERDGRETGDRETVGQIEGDQGGGGDERER